MSERAPTRAKILAPSMANLERAAELIRSGEIVGMPTETVYGLAGDAFNEKALAKIFNTKERPAFDPLIVHVAPGLAEVRTATVVSDDEGEEFEEETEIVSEDGRSVPVVHSWLALLERIELIDASQLTLPARSRAEALMQAFWPGPFTLVLPKHRRVPDLATSGLPSVAVRMPRHPVAQALIAHARTPLAAPSANRFGRISPTSAQDVLDELGDRIELIIDGGRCEVGVESTIISINAQGELQLLRPGGITLESIEQIAQVPVQRVTSVVEGKAAPAPGMLESHYAPRTPMTLLSRAFSETDDSELQAELRSLPRSKPVALLLFSGDDKRASQRLSAIAGGRSVICRVLSSSGDLEEAARALFADLRFLDGSGSALILAEPCPVATGLGFAITDRLARAAKKP